MIIFGVVAVVALAAYFLLLKKSSGPTEALPTPTQTSTAAPTPVPSVTTSPTPRSTTPPPVVVGGRDPFSPLVAQATGGGGGPTGPTGPTIPPTSVPPTSVPPTSPSVSPPASPPPTPVGGTTIVVGGHTITLIDIFHKNGVKYAQVSVDGTVYTVKQGDTFDGNFKLVDPADGCATFLFGDQQFMLCQNPQK
ncbi:MAG: hypothetical protein M3Q23_10235 [Actinomycetota bacterium]|nr:hypothetical protein [Actinomycetota bacterium]